MDAVRIQMRRRAPGSSDLTTHRSETDDPLVMSGILNGVTTGAPSRPSSATRTRTARPTIRRSRARATRTMPRPCASAARPTLRGGGPFSGRLTACLVFAGAVCRQILERRGITITANAVRVGQATARSSTLT